MAMGNNPIMYVDSDGRWVHIVIGGAIGTGAAITKLALEPGDIDWTSGRTWGKIGTGAVTGVAIAAMPLSAAGIFGAGSTAFAGDIGDQLIDVHHGYKKSIDFKQATVNGIITSATAGIGGAISNKLVKHGRGVLHATGKVPWYRLYPSLNAAAVNSTFDVSRFAIENHDPLFFSDVMNSLNIDFGNRGLIGSSFENYIDYNTSEYSNYGRSRGEIQLNEIVIIGKKK